MTTARKGDGLDGFINAGGFMIFLGILGLIYALWLNRPAERAPTTPAIEKTQKENR